jgi:ecdysteroid kinase
MATAAITDSVPPTPDSLSPEWLTAVLRQSLAITHARVASVAVTLISMGRGFVGQSARLKIEYDASETGAPATLFVKLSSADLAIRQKLRTLGFYETEAGFYRDLAALKTFPIRVPRCYFSQHDDRSGASIVLLEDLADARFGDNLLGCSLTEARSVVRHLALLHGHFWESPYLERCRWLRSAADDRESRTAIYRTMLPVFEQRCAEMLTSDFLNTAKKFAEVLPAYSDELARGPNTLVHGDFRPDNFAWITTSEGSEILIVFDWQGLRRSLGARDLAYFISISMPIEQRRSAEGELLEAYYQILLDCGVKDYSFEDLARDFQVGLGGLLVTAVTASGMLDWSSKRARSLLRELSARTAAVLEDHQFDRYLETLR